jgi:hypothetical protein
MVLTYDAYSETLESEKQKDDRVAVGEANAIISFNTV